MDPIVILMTLVTVLLAAAAGVLNLIQTLRRTAEGDALQMNVVNDPSRQDQIELELSVAPGVQAVTVKRIILERKFAAKVLAQAPSGFRERHPAPPPNYAAFEPDLGGLGDKKHISRSEFEAEKRRQHADLINSWADLCENVMTWEGNRTIRPGDDGRLVISMRTDVAASGRFTLIYTCRNGLIRTTHTIGADYRPLLVAVHG